MFPKLILPGSDRKSPRDRAVGHREPSPRQGPSGREPLCPLRHRYAKCASLELRLSHFFDPPRLSAPGRVPAGHGVHPPNLRSRLRPAQRRNNPSPCPLCLRGESSSLRPPLDMGSIRQICGLASAPRGGATILLRVLCVSVVNLLPFVLRWAWGSSLSFRPRRCAPASPPPASRHRGPPAGPPASAARTAGRAATASRCPRPI